MRSLRNTLRTRGFISTINRGMKMIQRYGLSEKKIKNSLLQISKDSRNHAIGFTVPVTGEILNDERAEFLREISHEQFEIAVHGFQHQDFSKRSDNDLRDDIVRARRKFLEYNLEPVGYRAPYLRTRENLLSLLADNGFEYSSSRTQIFDNRPSEEWHLMNLSRKISMEIYEPKKRGSQIEPLEISRGVVEIPISLPDDEILIDRMGIGETRVLEKILLDIISTSMRFDSFAVIQIHPERYLCFREALIAVVNKIREETNAEFTTLCKLVKYLGSLDNSESKGEFDNRFICFTGDLDIMSIADLWR